MGWIQTFFITLWNTSRLHAMSQKMLWKPLWRLVHLVTRWHKLSPKAHSEPSQTSKMEIFAKIVYGFSQLTIFAIGTIVNVWSVHNKMTIFDLLHKVLITILKNCELTSKQGWRIFFRYLENGHRDNIFHYNSPACFWWKSYNNFSFFCSWEIYESSTLFHCWLWVK